MLRNAYLIGADTVEEGPTFVNGFVWISQICRNHIGHGVILHLVAQRLLRNARTSNRTNIDTNTLSASNPPGFRTQRDGVPTSQGAPSVHGACSPAVDGRACGEEYLVLSFFERASTNSRAEWVRIHGVKCVESIGFNFWSPIEIHHFCNLRFTISCWLSSMLRPEVRILQTMQIFFLIVWFFLSKSGLILKSFSNRE